MKLLENVNLSLRCTLIVFMVFGIWGPNYTGFKKLAYNIYSFFLLMFIIGIYIIVQVGDLIKVWGNLPLMTATIFLLFTNIALGTKVINAIWRKETIRSMLAETNDELSSENRKMGKDIVKSCDRETTKLLSIYCVLSYTTVLGWASSAEKNQLPLRAWYPYDTSKTPTYQLTYAHQTIAVSLAAAVNICLDTLVTSLISQCRCRLRLLSLSLKTLCHDLEISDKGVMTDASNAIVSNRLQNCVLRHQTVLAQTRLLQNCFSAPIFGQFCVSMIIICVTAYQLAFVRVFTCTMILDLELFLLKESTSLARVISMVSYLTVMMLQVFLYCYQGNQLVEDIIKASYTFFTVLQQMEES